MSRKAWTRQPPEAARLSIGNDLARGIALAWTPRGVVDLATGLRITPIGSPTMRTSGPAGTAYKAASGFNYAEFADDSRHDITGAVTCLAVCRPYSVASDQSTHAKTEGNGATNSPFDFGLNSANVRIARANGSAYRVWASSGLTVEANKVCAIAASMSGDMSVTPLFAHNGKTSASGSSLYSGFGSGAATANTLSTKVGNRDDRGTLFDGEIYFVVAWNRQLSISELAEVTRNPWALFASRNEPTFFLGPAAGGVTIDAAAGAASAAGIGAGVASPVTISAGAGQAAASGIGASVASPQTVAASTGAASAAGIDASVASPITIQASAGSAAAAGLQAGVSSGASISAATGAASAIGISAGVASPITVASLVGAASGTGLGASVSSGNQIAATTGAASAAGLSASISSPQTVSAATGLASAAGLQAGVGTGTTIPAALGAASALGLTATVTAATHIVAAVGAAAAAGLGASVRNDGDAPSAPSSRRIAAVAVLRSIVGPAANRRIQ